MPLSLPSSVTVATDIYQPVFSLAPEPAGRRSAVVLMPLFCLLLAPDAHALSHIRLIVDSIKQSDKQLIGLQLNWHADQTSIQRLSISADQIRLQNDKRTVFSKLQIDCQQLEIDSTALDCPALQLTFTNPLASAKNANARLSWNPDKQHADLAIDKLGLAGGQAQLNASLENSDWNITLHLKQLKLADLAAASSQLPADLSINGNLSGNIIAKGQLMTQLQASYQLNASQLSFSNTAGNYLAEAIDLTAEGGLKLVDTSAPLKGTLKLSVKNGELLTPQFYKNFKQSPLLLQLDDARYSVNDHYWSIHQVEISQPLYNVTIKKLTGDNNDLDTASVELFNLPLKQLYEQNLQPILTQDLAQLKLDGKLSALVKVENGNIGDYEIILKNVDVQHIGSGQTSKFTVNDLNATLLYNQQYPDALSEISFGSAQMFETIKFGATVLPLETAPGSIELQPGTKIPVFDGALIIDTFRLGMTNDSPQVDFQGILTPVSLPQLSEAFDWPKMQGKISGLIPSISYSNGNAKFDGTLLVRAFNGNVLIRDIEASHLLSSWPVLKADIDIRQLDLEQLTNTFSFGKITGLLDGHIHRLQMENWQPVAFDAAFQTSAESVNRRISQKAVDNISNLGGAGVAGALSRTFMRIFEDFGYDKIGISCKLENGICQMDGVAPANQGYYLVKGGSIPRIDVIGYNHQTDWSVLVDRLSNISSSGSPTVQ